MAAPFANQSVELALGDSRLGVWCVCVVGAALLAGHPLHIPLVLGTCLAYLDLPVSGVASLTLPLEGLIDGCCLHGHRLHNCCHSYCLLEFLGVPT
jgi:hypothetical protein